MAAPRRVDELKLLQADYFNLRTHCDKIQAKANEQAKDLKETRRLNETLDKNLSALRRKYEQLSLDKRELDEQAEANREYAKRVEQKLLMGSKGQVKIVLLAKLILPPTDHSSCAHNPVSERQEHRATR
jgi:hypothetical protein